MSRSAISRNILKLSQVKYGHILPFSTQPYLCKKENENLETSATNVEKEPKMRRGTDFYTGPKNLYDEYPDKIRYRKHYSSPFERTIGILKDDVLEAFGKLKATPVLHMGSDKTKKINQQSTALKVFPEHCDLLIIGGGIMGASIAFHIQEFVEKGMEIVVIDKDHSYSKASTVLSAGGIRQQFSLPENIQLSRYGFDFLQKSHKLLAIPNLEPPSIPMCFGGYLTLASEEGMPNLLKNYSLQRKLDVEVLLLRKKQLKERFPWIETEGVEGGVYGLHGEGWFDPWSLLMALVRKCQSLGTNFVQGEVVDADIKQLGDQVKIGEHITRVNEITSVEVKLPDGERRTIKFRECVLAAGAWSGGLGHTLGIGKLSDPLMSVPLPIVPRKRFIYAIKSEDNGPGLNCPLVVNPDGSYFRREGLGNVYLCGSSPTKEEEPPIDDLSVDDSFFQNRVWPSIAERVEAFKSIKVESSWAGYYDYNTFDQNGFVGRHPCYYNLILAAGFSGHGLQHAPGIGKAIMDLILHEEYRTLNLERMAFDRLYFDDRLEEDCLV